MHQRVGDVLRLHVAGGLPANLEVVGVDGPGFVPVRGEPDLESSPHPGHAGFAGGIKGVAKGQGIPNPRPYIEEAGVVGHLRLEPVAGGEIGQAVGPEATPGGPVGGIPVDDEPRGGRPDLDLVVARLVPEAARRARSGGGSRGP
jgi:hypothetical protein